MKKAFVLLLALAVLGGAVFAEDAAYTLSGSASLTWGYNLNTEAHGFTNTAEATLTIPLVAENSSTHGEEAITGSITISDFSYVLSTDADEQTLAAGDVTAKILFPNGLYLKIASAPSFSINYAQRFMTWKNSGDDWVDSKLVNPKITSAGGFALGMTGDFSFALNVGSTNKHTSGPYVYTLATGIDDFTMTGADEYYIQPVAGTYIAVPEGQPIMGDTWFGEALYTRSGDGVTPTNEYIVGLDLGYTMGDMATIAAKMIYGPLGADVNVFGAGVKVTSKPITGLALVLGFDFKAADPGAGDVVNGMDLMFTADYTMADLFSFGAGAYYAKTNLELDPATLDARVRASLLAVPALTFKVGVDLWDLIADPANDPQKVLLGVNVAYKADLSETTYVKPYANIAYSLVSEGSYMNFGVEAGLIPLTTFTLDYKAGKVTTDNVTISPITDDDKGIITFTTKITY